MDIFYIITELLDMFIDREDHGSKSKVWVLSSKGDFYLHSFLLALLSLGMSPKNNLYPFKMVWKYGALLKYKCYVGRLDIRR